MPELPEVETIARRLRLVLPGKQITSLKVFKDKSFGGAEFLVVGSTITDILRKAKVVTLKLDNGHFLATHLKMTGQLIYKDAQQSLGGGHPTADWISSLPSSHTRIQYDLSDGAKLFFNDQRIFGWMRVLNEAGYQEIFANWGPDINDPQVTAKYLYSMLSRRGIPIKQAIMDNKVVCGIGNIYACDSLNIAKISPFRPAKSLSMEEVELLYQVSLKVINRGIELGGTTFDGAYVGIDGFAGGYQHEIKAYGRVGQPCYNCGAKILKEKIGGRGTFYCGVCQV